jgi:hypothetical protein
MTTTNDHNPHCRFAERSRSADAILSGLRAKGRTRKQRASERQPQPEPEPAQPSAQPECSPQLDAEESRPIEARAAAPAGEWRWTIIPGHFPRRSKRIWVPLDDG